MPAEVILDEARITDCTFNPAGGELRYDLSYLHPDWEFLVQSYRIDSQDFEGRYIYTSEFLLFKQGEAVPSSFAAYSRELKDALWDVIFAVKRRFLEQYKPDIVLHFIKQPSSVAQRLPRYEHYLTLPYYFIETTAQEIFYFYEPTWDADTWDEASDDIDDTGEGPPEFFPHPFGEN